MTARPPINSPQLNPEQRRAVEHLSGPILVLAGAGSGKTRVITHRIARLLQSGVEPRELLALTFTNKAAGEMRERAEKLLGASAAGLWIGTFHGICARLLRIYGEHVGLSKRFIIYDSDDQQTLVKRVLRDLGVPERLFSPRDVLSHLDRAKNQGIGPRQYEGGDFYTDVVAKVYPRYERALVDADATDFGNLLLKTLELLREHDELAGHLSSTFRHVLVDEFQDTNRVQYDLVSLLSSKHHNLCVVGDDDQSIYGWRGADIRNILDFERDHPSAAVVKLEQNYRSTQTILDAAGAVITRNIGRKKKTLWTEAGRGQPIVVATCFDERDEASFLASSIRELRAREGLALDDFAIFYRTHAQSRAVEEALRSASLPHAVVGGIRFYDRAEIKNLLAYLRLIANPADEVSLRRIINIPVRGIGKTTLERVSTFARTQQLTMLAAARACGRGEGSSATLIKSGARDKLAAFCELIDELAAEIETLGPAALAEAVLERTGYLERLAADGSVESETRTENLLELIASLRDYEQRAEEPSLFGFLEQVALSSEVDQMDDSGGSITLMTVHSAKGLEFPVVYLIGLEQGIFPHSRSLDDVEKMEEERRLAYVAITRARRRLFLLHAQQRWVFGQQQTNAPSAFLREIPEHLVERPRSPATPRYTGPHAPVQRPGLRPSTQRPGVQTMGAQRPTITLPAGRSRRSATAPTTRKPAAPARQPDEVWVDYEFDQSPSFDVDDFVDMAAEEAPAPQAVSFRIGMRVRHAKYGVGVVQAITGSAPALNLTIRFPSGPHTIRSQFVQPA